jgi:hypothetical protein
MTALPAEGSGLGARIAAPRTWSEDLGRPNRQLRELSYAATVLQRLAPVVHTVHGALTEPGSTYYRALPRGGRAGGDQPEPAVVGDLA